jgi:hypothetical protein
MSANAKQHWQPRLVCSRPVACGLVLVSSFKKKRELKLQGKGSVPPTSATATPASKVPDSSAQGQFESHRALLIRKLGARSTADLVRSALLHHAVQGV